MTSNLFDDNFDPDANRPDENDSDFARPTEVTSMPSQPIWFQAIRWIVALPLAYIGSQFAYWLWHGFMWLSYSRTYGESNIEHIITQYGGNVLTGASFVYIAAKVVPKFSVFVALVSAGLILALSIFSCYYVVTHMWEYSYLFGAIAMSLGATFTAYILYGERPKTVSS